MQLVSEKMRNKAKHAKQNVQFISFMVLSVCVCFTYSTIVYVQFDL